MTEARRCAQELHQNPQISATRMQKPPEGGFAPSHRSSGGSESEYYTTPVRWSMFVSGIEPASAVPSAQVVPDPTATTVLVQRAAFDQHPEMLLERVATGASQLDGLADGDATMLAGELDDL